MDENQRSENAGSALNELLKVVAHLRSDTGCAWDRAQTWQTLKPYLLEETYEVLEALDGKRAHLKEELGDLLFQITFFCQLAQEEGEFSAVDVIRGITQKMLERHPHVFGNERLRTMDEVQTHWERSKREKRRATNGHASVLDGIPAALPALTQARRLGEKAAGVGFDWPDRHGVEAKIQEEMGELQVALLSEDRKAIESELGDVLFSVVNLARFMKLDPEDCLRRTNMRFKGRFQYLEAALSGAGSKPELETAQTLNNLWDEAKRALKEHE